MSLVAIGAVLGLLCGGGLLLTIFASPPMRRPSLSDRVAPYLRDATPPSRLLGDTTTAPPSALRRITAPLLRDAVRFLEHIVGGGASVRRRLAALGSPLSIEQFRTEQVVWAAIGTGAGLGITLIAIVSNHRSPALLILIVLGSMCAGVVARDWWLSQSVSKHNAETLAEFPVIAEMLALAVAAGEGPANAIERVCRLTRGHLTSQLERVLSETRAGAPLQTALHQARDATALEPLARFLDGMAVAIDRGTPMADVLHAQAADVRALGKRQLLEAGGKKEILMMTPVVFLILPVTILFAFFPGLIAITTVAH
ncbi:MAG: type II secretion system F family protein [Nakamurella sp.]